MFHAFFTPISEIQERQVIILHNLANWATFGFSLDIDYWLVK